MGNIELRDRKGKGGTIVIVATNISATLQFFIIFAPVAKVNSNIFPHHVNFQMTSCDAGKLAHGASVRLFPRVGPFVLLQIV